MDGGIGGRGGALASAARISKTKARGAGFFEVGILGWQRGERRRRLDPGQLVPDACRPEAEANIQCLKAT